MPYTIDSSSCVKGGTFTLSAPTNNVLGSTYSTSTLNS